MLTIRRAALTAAATVAIATGTVVTASGASAGTGCSYGTDGSRGAYSSCASGWHRSWVQCRDNWWPNNWYTVDGPWQNGSTLSKSSCNFHSTRYSYGITHG